jgi:hypothetical protein
MVLDFTFFISITSLKKWYYSATVFWLHAHQTMPLNSSDISKGQKIAVCDWTPTQQLLDKSCFKGENSN